MTKLHQFIALMEAFKAEENRRYARAYHDAQKPVLFDGLTRTYEPRDEDGEVFRPSPPSCSAAPPSFSPSGATPCRCCWTPS